MNGQEERIDLIAVKDAYAAKHIDRAELYSDLHRQGFNEWQIDALCNVFDECITEERVAATAWESAQESRAMCSRYVACNPTYLALKYVDLELDILEDEILHIRQRLTQFVRIEPDVYTYEDVDQILARVTSLAARLGDEYGRILLHAARDVKGCLHVIGELDTDPSVLDLPRDPSCVALGEMVEEPPDQSQDHPACGNAWDLEPDDDDGIPF